VSDDAEYKRCQYISNGQQYINVNIVQFAIGYLLANQNRKTQSLSWQIGTDGSNTPRQTHEVPALGTGSVRQAEVVRVCCFDSFSTTPYWFCKPAMCEGKPNALTPLVLADPHTVWLSSTRFMWEIQFLSSPPVMWRGMNTITTSRVIHCPQGLEDVCSSLLNTFWY